VVRDLFDYFRDMVRILGSELGAEELSEPTILQRAYQFGRLACSFRYVDASHLRVILWADCNEEPIVWTSYSFQYLDANGDLRFRYDNAGHYPQLPNFPSHLHLPEAVHGVRQPQLRQIALRIRQYLAFSS